MTARRSHLLVGTVRHRRRRWTGYDFTHRVWYLGIALEELPNLGLRLLAVNGRNVLSLNDRDHFGSERRGLVAEVAERLQTHGLSPDAHRVTLVTYPRAFGYVFNPVSFFLVHDEAGRLPMVIAEVHNTHGDRQVYEFVPDRADARVFHAVQTKQMYVSPFIAPGARYELRVWEAGNELSIAIHEFEDDELALYAAIRLTRQPLTDAALMRQLVRDPLMSLRTTGLIMLHAARLWLRGVPWQRYRRRHPQQDRS